LRWILCILLLASACHYDTSGVLHLDDDTPGIDASPSDVDANRTQDDAAPSPDAAAPVPPDAHVPPDADVPPDAAPSDECHPACGPLEVCCDDGTCAGLGLCF
jgi:hypothetical protein